MYILPKQSLSQFLMNPSSSLRENYSRTSKSFLGVRVTLALLAGFIGLQGDDEYQYNDLV